MCNSNDNLFTMINVIQLECNAVVKYFPGELSEINHIKQEKSNRDVEHIDDNHFLIYHYKGFRAVQADSEDLITPDSPIIFQIETAFVITYHVNRKVDNLFQEIEDFNTIIGYSHIKPYWLEFRNSQLGRMGMLKWD